MHLTFPPKSQWPVYADKLEKKLKRGDHEVEIRKFLTKHPWILALEFGGGEGAIFSEYRLASNQQPDHLILSGRSHYADITLVELKHPKARLLTAAGNSMTSYMNQALTKTIQRQDILRRRKGYFLSQFNEQIDELLNKRSRPFQGVIDPKIRGKLRLPLYEYKVSSRIVIGRREFESVKEWEYRRSIWDGNNPTEIIPYDRILDRLRLPPGSF